jgi:hypothetical protein
MKLSACLLLLLVGCTDADGPKYEVVAPSGTGTTGGGGTSTAKVTGRVCVLADPQLLTACSISGGGGLSVTQGSATATTANDGSFSFEPDGTSPANTPISVTGTGVVASQASAGGQNIVPVMSNDMYNRMVLATGITITPDSGAILANVANSAGVSATGITATSNPTGTSGPFFDGTGESPWSLDATGARGVAFFPNVTTQGPTSLTFTDPTTAGETTVDGVQVVDGGITYVDVALP